MIIFLEILKWLSLGCGLFILGYIIWGTLYEKRPDELFLERFVDIVTDDLSAFGVFILAILFLSSFVFLLNFMPKYRYNYFKEEAVYERFSTKDRKLLESYGSKKIELEDILVRTKDPSFYVIAPMSYDTKKFKESNSKDKNIFGSITDNSEERLMILENCITDFTQKVDNIMGVSFIDRSKITQIEKEHKFQLGDWSNNKKTAELGNALNANILLFLDKFGYIDAGAGEYRFEAKFVDINTMQSSSFNIVYKNPKRKIVTPEIVKKIDFRDFTMTTSTDFSFDDELNLKTKQCFRTVQRADMDITSPIGKIDKYEFSKYDELAPKSNLFFVDALNFDGFGSVEIKIDNQQETGTYTFEAEKMRLEKIDEEYYTDGKIGFLSIQSPNLKGKFDVYKNEKDEYFLSLSVDELGTVIVNYFLQLEKK